MTDKLIQDEHLEWKQIKGHIQGLVMKESKNNKKYSAFSLREDSEVKVFTNWNDDELSDDDFISFRYEEKPHDFGVYYNVKEILEFKPLHTKPNKKDKVNFEESINDKLRLKIACAGIIENAMRYWNRANMSLEELQPIIDNFLMIAGLDEDFKTLQNSTNIHTNKGDKQ